MKINLPKIHKTNINSPIECQNINSIIINKSIYSSNCDDYDDCYDCDNGYYDDDDEWHSFDCLDCDCDCHDCDCDCYDCDCNDCNHQSGSGVYYVIGVRYKYETHGCYYYLCYSNEYSIGDTVMVPTSQGPKEATVCFVKTYYYKSDLPYPYEKMKYAPRKKLPVINTPSSNYSSNDYSSNNYSSNSNSDYPILNAIFEFFYNHPIIFIVVIVLIIGLLFNSCN